MTVNIAKWNHCEK